MYIQESTPCLRPEAVGKARCRGRRRRGFVLWGLASYLGVLPKPVFSLKLPSNSKCKYTYTHTDMFSTYLCTYSFIHLFIHSFIHLFIYIYIYVYIHTCEIIVRACQALMVVVVHATLDSRDKLQEGFWK